MTTHLTKNFSRNELQCKCGCGSAIFHADFLDELQALRDELNEPMTPTSCCRCTKHNAAVGGKPESYHICDGELGTLAIDVATPNGAYRGKLFAIAWRRGWSIGWNDKKNFLHLDMRILVGKPQTTFGY